MVIVNSEGEGQCQECGETNILDSTLNICFDCWCLLDIQEAERRANELLVEVELEEE